MNQFHAGYLYPASPSSIRRKTLASIFRTSNRQNWTYGLTKPLYGQTPNPRRPISSFYYPLLKRHRQR